MRAVLAVSDLLTLEFLQRSPPCLRMLTTCESHRFIYALLSVIAVIAIPMVVLIHQSGPRYLIILTWKSSKVRTCGMICSANYSSKGPGRFYSTLAKEPLNCKRLIRRLNDSVSQTEKEKLRNMPRDMVDTFTLGNRYPIELWAFRLTYILHFLG